MTEITGVFGTLVNPAGVAVGTIECTVNPTQRKRTQGMPKLTVLPKGLAVAFLAGGKRGVVNVVLLVADQTLITQTTELAPFFIVALGTLKSVMNPLQSVIAVKVFDGLPIIFAVTAAALLPHFVFVFVIFAMAGIAILVEGSVADHGQFFVLIANPVFSRKVTLLTL